MYRYRKHLFGSLLTNNVLIELPPDFRRLRHTERRRLATGVFIQLFVEDNLTDIDRIIANIDVGAGNKLAHLRVAFATERAHGEIGSPRHLTSATEFHAPQEVTTLPLFCGSRSARTSLRDFPPSSSKP